ncbi:MAG: glutamate 5-kinase [Moorellales bacterium]
MIESLTKTKRLVVKVGTSILAYPDGRLNLFRLERLVRELAAVANSGREVVLVTSGAVGTGMGRLGWTKKPRTLPEKQAAAAVGQGILMHIYEKLFAEYGQVVAQVLLTRQDLADRGRYLNARHTLLTLLRYRAIPIVNENDTVAVEEIRVGDNDTLSALVAGLVDADLLLLLTDTDGLYTANPRTCADARRLDLVTEITPEIEQLAGTGTSPLGTGGVGTKLAAAHMAMNSGIPMVIAHGGEERVIERTLAGEQVGTLFLPHQARLAGRKRWIAYGPPVQGRLWVDAGAVEALVRSGKSLLPAGLTRVEGEFEAGAVVSVCDPQGREIARGIVNYGAQELERIKGCRSADIPRVLGHKDYDEVIHRDNLCLL